MDPERLREYKGRTLALRLSSGDTLCGKLDVGHETGAGEDGKDKFFYNMIKAEHSHNAIDRAIELYNEGVVGKRSKDVDFPFIRKTYEIDPEHVTLLRSFD